MFIASQFAGSSGPFPYSLHVFSRSKCVFPQLVSLPSKTIVMHISIYLCKAAVRIDVGFGLGLGFGLVLQFGFDSWF